MDISINENKLDVLNDSNKMNINLGTSKVVTHEKNHANLDNLDFENSGHTGFQPAGNYVEDNNYVHTDNNFTDEDKEKLDSLENFSGNASDISYEDTYGNDYVNVQEAIDGALWLGEYLNQNDIIKRLHNNTINLRNLPTGIYILTGKETTIKSNNGDTNGTFNNPILDDEKILLITIGKPEYSRAILYSYDNRYTALNMRVITGTSMNTYNLLGLLTTSGAETITGTKTFTAVPRCSVGPTVNHHLTHKQYVDRIVRESKYATDLGYIHLDDYGGDVFSFIDTLINEGRYRFIDDYDDFEWYVEVYRTNNYAGQIYWGSEEGFPARYLRHGFYNEDDDTVEWQNWVNYLTSSMAYDTLASRDHVHHKTTEINDLRTWLDTQKHTQRSEYEVTQTSNKHKFIVKFNTVNYILDGKMQYIRYQEYYDIEEPNKIYKRTGKASTNTILATMTWGSWYVFEGVEE